MHTYKPVHPGGFVVGYYIAEPQQVLTARGGTEVIPGVKFVRLGFLRDEFDAMERVSYLNGSPGAGVSRRQAKSLPLWDTPPK